MHEESLVRSLLHQVEDLAQQHHATEVEDIEVEIGPLSGVEPLLVREAFERLKDGCTWPSCIIPVIIVCMDKYQWRRRPLISDHRRQRGSLGGSMDPWR